MLPNPNCPTELVAGLRTVPFGTMVCLVGWGVDPARIGSGICSKQTLCYRYVPWSLESKRGNQPSPGDKRLRSQRPFAARDDEFHARGSKEDAQGSRAGALRLTA